MANDSKLHEREIETLIRLSSMEKGTELRYRVGSEDAREPRVRELLRALAHQCGKFARELRVLAAMFGGPPPLANAAPAGDDLVAALEVRSTRALLAECAYREDAATLAYATARGRRPPAVLDAALARFGRAHFVARADVLAMAGTDRMRASVLRNAPSSAPVHQTR